MEYLLSGPAILIFGCLETLYQPPQASYFYFFFMGPYVNHFWTLYANLSHCRRFFKLKQNIHNILYHFNYV